VEEAIDMARADSMAEDAIVVTGSLYIVGAARPYLRKVIN
jgi:folylpolyglutamate synthase/dihydropteroate synthase